MHLLLKQNGKKPYGNIPYGSAFYLRFFLAAGFAGGFLAIGRLGGGV